MRGFRLKWILIALILLVVPWVSSILVHPIHAQSGTGTIAGMVKDETGGIVPGVEVSVRNEATNVERSTVSNGSGFFRLQGLHPGIYQVKAELTGFRTTVNSGVELTVGAVLSLDFTLEVGEINEIVTVRGQEIVVDTEDSQISSLVDHRRVLDLPLNGRNIYVLATLQPGVVPAMMSVIQSGGPNSESFVSAGTRFRGNQFTFDGAHNTSDGVSGLPVIMPSVDTVQEFRLIRNNFSAEFGTHSGTVVNLVSRSGTNQFHGSVYEFHRNGALDASGVFDPFDTATGEKEQTPLVQNQFGFVVGGPVVQDRIFFFGSYEGLRRKVGGSGTFQVETPEFRAHVIQNFPNSTAAQIFQLAPARAPTSNIVTTQDIADAGGPPACFFCGPTLFPPDLPVKGTTEAFADKRKNWDQYSIRFDSNFKEGAIQLFGRYTLHDALTEAPFPQRPAFVDNLESFQQQLSITVKQVWSPTRLNEFRFTYLYDRSDNSTTNPHIPHMLITGSPAGLDLFDNIGGFAGFPQLFTTDTFQWQDIVSFTVGNHFLRAGLDLRRVREDSDFAQAARPLVVYRGLFDFALDAPYFYSAGIDPASGDLSSTPREFRSSEVGWFIQDDWKIHPRLTLNLGLRWDFFGPGTETRGRLSNIRFPGGGSYFENIFNATVGVVDQLYDADLNNFAPRLGFAWDPSGNNTTVLRGGYGISYDKIFLNIVTNSRFNPPFFGLVGLSNIIFGDDLSVLPRIGDNPGDPFGGFLGNNILEPLGFDERGGIVGSRVDLRVLDPAIRDSYVHNFFFGIQRELPWDMVWETNYQGTFGKKLQFIGDPNRFAGDLLGKADPLGNNEGDAGTNLINPSFGSFNLRQNRITSNYHGLNSQLRKRFADGFSFQMSYTYGKSLDYNSDVGRAGLNNGGSGLYFVDPINIALDYGRSNFDIRHRFVTNFLWEVPFMKNQPGMLGHLLGGWQVNAIIPFQTGLPFSVINGASLRGGGDFNADGKSIDRPHTPTFGNKFNSPPGTSEFIDGVLEAGDFPSPEIGTSGNLGKNTFTGPAFWSVDLSLFKNFPMAFNEETMLQFRAEFFNLFNRVNLFLPQVDLDSSLFGMSTTAFDPREIQFALKFIF